MLQQYSLISTGVWVNYSYLDKLTNPNTGQETFTCIGFDFDSCNDYERNVEWNYDLESWVFDGFLVTKWLLEDRLIK